MLYKIYFIAFDVKLSFDNVLIFIIQDQTWIWRLDSIQIKWIPGLKMDPEQVEWLGQYVVDVVAPKAQQGRHWMTRFTPNQYSTGSQGSMGI